MTDRDPLAEHACYSCKTPIMGTEDVGGAVEFSFGRFPLCLDCGACWDRLRDPS